MVVVTLFVVSLLTGGLGIYVGARLVVGEEEPRHAILTGLLGAIVWVVGGVFFGWIPLLVLAVYAWMVDRRYPGGWRNAVSIALIAWLVTVVVLTVLGSLGFATYEAIGVPFA